MGKEDSSGNFIPVPRIKKPRPIIFWLGLFLLRGCLFELKSQFARLEGVDGHPMAGFKAGLLQPAPAQSYSGFDLATGKITDCLNFQSALVFICHRVEEPNFQRELYPSAEFF